MKKYIINEMDSDGYERFAVVREIGKKAAMNVHFLEYDEYLENGKQSVKRKQGDVLEGDLLIELVAFSERVEEALTHCQEIGKSPHIKAVVEVVQVIDAYSIYAFSTVSDDCILIAFEDKVNYLVGERILVVGSLELTF